MTRIRTMETTCDFEHTVPVKGLGTDMRIDADAAVQETEGSAANGRMTLRALLGIRLNAFETAEKELITDAEAIDSPTEGKIGGLRIKKQRVALCRHRTRARTRRSFGRNSICLPSSAWAMCFAHRARQRLRN